MPKAWLPLAIAGLMLAACAAPLPPFDPQATQATAPALGPSSPAPSPATPSPALAPSPLAKAVTPTLRPIGPWPSASAPCICAPTVSVKLRALRRCFLVG